MLRDHRPELPMTVLVRLALRGSLDNGAVAAALSSAVAEHPLLSARADLATGRWVPGDLDADVLDTASDAERGPAPDPRHGPGVRAWTARADGRTELWLELHHAACDGRSAFRFASDALAAYERLRAGGVTSPRSARPWADLASRSRRPGGGAGRLLALVGAARFLHGDPVALAGRPQRLPPSPPGVARGFSTEEPRSVRDEAHRLGVTLNTFLLRNVFLALAAWQRERDLPGSLRVAVPVALDRNGPTSPSAPRVSMVFLDRAGTILSRPEELLRSVAGEMTTIRRYRLEPAFLAGLSLARSVRGGLDRALARRRPWATAVMTKLDEPLGGDGAGLVEDALVVSPVRPGTAVAFGAVVHRGRLTFAARFDPARLSSADAASLVDAVLSRDPFGCSAPSQANRRAEVAC